MPVLNNPAGYVLSGAVASGAAASSALDCRHCANYAYFYTNTTVASALVALQVSHDGVTWLTHSLYTAVAAGVTAQIAAHLPYVRAVVNARYGASTANAYYAPGLT